MASRPYTLKTNWEHCFKLCDIILSVHECGVLLLLCHLFLLRKALAKKNVINFVLLLEVPGPISQNGNFYLNDASSPKKSWLQISFKSV